MRTTRALASVAWANLAGQRVQALLIALTLAASAGLLTFGLAAQAATTNAFDRLWRRTDGADLWLYFDAARVTPAEAANALSHVPGVVASTPPQPQVPVIPAGVVQTGFGSGFVLREWPSPSQTLGRSEIVAGHAPQAGDRDVIVVDVNVARSFHFHVGDTVGIPTPSGVRSLKVIGLDVNPQNCPYPLCGPPQTLFVSPGHLGDLGLLSATSPGELAVGVRVQPPSRSRDNEVVRSLTSLLPPGSLSVAEPASKVRQLASFGYATQSGLLLMFASVASIAAVLLIVVAIAGPVRADSRRIGLLKAVGFSTAQLRVASLCEYVGLALVGGAVGATLGAIIAPHILTSVSQQYGTRAPGTPWPLGLIALAVVTVLTTVVVLLASRRPVALDAATALRSDPTGSRSATGLMRGPVVVARALSELGASRTRSILTALALALAAATLVISSLLQAGLGVFADGLVFDGGRTGDLLIRATSQLPSDRLEHLLGSQPGVTGVVRTRNAWISLPGSTDIWDTFLLRFRGGDTNGLPQSLVAGRQLQRSGEAVIGYALAKKRQLRVGDALTFGLGGNSRTLRVVGINRDVNNLGRIATTLETSFPDARPFDQPQYVVRLQRGTSPAVVSAAIKRATGGVVTPVVISSAILPPSLRSIKPVITVLASILAFLTALGVFNAVLLTMKGRRREFGLVRAVGMTRQQVVGVALTGTVAQALAACIVAVPLALVVGRIVLHTVQKGVGIGPLSLSTPTGVFAVGPAVVAIAVLGALGPAWSASKTDVTTVLRHL